MSLRKGVNMQNGTTDKQRGIENLIRRALKQNKLRNRSFESQRKFKGGHSHFELELTFHILKMEIMTE